MILNTLKNIIAENEKTIAEKRSAVATTVDAAELSILNAEIRSLQNENKKYQAEIADIAEKANSRADAIYGLADSDLPGYEKRTAFYNKCKDIINAQLRGEGITTITDTQLAVPEEVSPELLVYMKDVSPLINELNMTVSVNDITFKESEATIVANWTAAGNELNAMKDQKLTVDKEYTIRGHVLSVRIRITDLAGCQTMKDFFNKLVEIVGDAMVDQICYAAVKGTGVGMPLGIVNDERVVNVIEVTEEDFVNADTWIGFDDIVGSRYKVNTKMLMNPATFSGLKKLKDGTGAYLGDFTVNHDGNTKLFMDKPVIDATADMLPSFANAANGEVFAIYGNFKHYRMNAKKNGALSMYKWTDMNNYTDVYDCVSYLDGRVVTPHSFILFKKKVN